MSNELTLEPEEYSSMRPGTAVLMPETKVDTHHIENDLQIMPIKYDIKYAITKQQAGFIVKYVIGWKLIAVQSGNFHCA